MTTDAQKKKDDVLLQLAQLNQELTQERQLLEARAGNEIEYYIKGKLCAYDMVIGKLQHILEVACGDEPKPAS